MESAPTRPTRRVLLVQDDAVGRTAMGIVLSRLGCEVFEAEDGYAAITRAVVIRPHLILVDLGLPELDGYQVGEALRAVLGELVQLVAVSGDRPEGQGLKHFDGCLIRPVTPEQLARLCDQAATPPPR